MENSITEDAMEKKQAEMLKEEEALVKQLAQVRRHRQAIDLYLKMVRGELPLDDPGQVPPATSKPLKESANHRAARGERRAQLCDILGRRSEGYTWAELKKIAGVSPGHDELRLYSALQNMKRVKLAMIRLMLHRLAHPNRKRLPAP